jgi:SRSO17 transposase
MNKRNRTFKRRASRRAPPSGRKPECRLTVREVTTSAEELLAYHHEFQALFQRREQRAWSWLYLCGQLSNLERKTMEAIVLAFLGPLPKAIRGLQHFIGQGAWESQPLVEHAQSWVARW